MMSEENLSMRIDILSQLLNEQINSLTELEKRFDTLDRNVTLSIEAIEAKIEKIYISKEKNRVFHDMQREIEEFREKFKQQDKLESVLKNHLKGHLRIREDHDLDYFYKEIEKEIDKLGAGGNLEYPRKYTVQIGDNKYEFEEKPTTDAPADLSVDKDGKVRNPAAYYLGMCDAAKEFVKDIEEAGKDDPYSANLFYEDMVKVKEKWQKRLL